MKFLALLFLVIGCAHEAPKTQAPPEKEIILGTLDRDVLQGPEIAPVTVFTVKPASLKLYPWLQKVADKANCVYNQPGLISEIAHAKKFTHTTLTPAQVAKKLTSPNPVILASYWYRGFLGRTNVWATTYSSDTKHVYFNIYKWGKNPTRNLDDAVETALHEWSHLNGFGHGDNSGSQARVNAVPIYLEAIAKRRVKDCK